VSGEHRLAMQSDPRSHTKRFVRAIWCGFVDRSGVIRKEQTKQNYDTTELRDDLKLGI